MGPSTMMVLCSASANTAGTGRVSLVGSGRRLLFMGTGIHAAGRRQCNQSHCAEDQELLGHVNLRVASKQSTEIKV